MRRRAQSAAGILAVASGCHDDYPLVCIHNREEERDRPTTPCDFRPSGVICALDELKGGTWMGLNRSSGLFSSLKVCHGSDETAEGLRLTPLFSAIVPGRFRR